MKSWTALLAAVLVASPAAAAAPTAAPDTRSALIRYLDAAAASQTAARRQSVASLRTREDVVQRQADVRAKVLSLIGGLPRSSSPLAARTTGRGQGDGFRTENVIFDSMPGQHVTATLFIPSAGKGPYPAVLIAPGHSPAGRQGDYSFAANFARNGIAALTYDIVGEGERLQYYDPQVGASKVGRPTGEHSMAAFHTALLGKHVSRYFIFDAVRAIDYLQTRPEVDDARIGAFGCSGGGTVTAYLAALEPRVKAAGVACYVNDFDHLLAGPGPQDGEQSIPDFLAAGLDLPDWVELAAPKPYAVISTTEDMFPFAGAKAAVEDAKPFWAAYGAEGALQWITGPGGHGALTPMADKIIGFFRDALDASGAALPFTPARPADPLQMMSTPTGQAGGATIAQINQAEAATARPASAVTPSTVRALARIEAEPLPGRGGVVRIDEVRDGLSWSTVTFNSPRGPLEGRLVRPVNGSNGKTALILDVTAPQGLARPGGRLESLAKKGWTVLALQARGADGVEEIKSPIVGDQNLLAMRAMLVGKTLVGLRADDALQAVEWLSATQPGPLTLVGVGFQGPVALHAAALDERIKAVRLESSQLSYRLAATRPLQRDLPAILVPGALYAYDLPDLITLIAPRPVTIVSPLDPVGQPLRGAELKAILPQGAAKVSLAAYADDGW